MAVQSNAQLQHLVLDSHFHFLNCVSFSYFRVVFGCDKKVQVEKTMNCAALLSRNEGKEW